MSDTTVSYHRDGFGPARPAVNVKVYTSHQVMLPPGFERAYDNGTTRLPEADRLINAAWDQLQERFWQDAAGMADSLGLGPIEQEGRSGGWLVLTDGRDPQDPTTLRNVCGLCLTCWPLPRSSGTECHDDECPCHGERAAKEWLAAYRKLSGWCAKQVAAAPARVAALAQQLAMDELGAEPARRMFAHEIAAEGPHYEPGYA